MSIHPLFEKDPRLDSAAISQTTGRRVFQPAKEPDPTPRESSIPMPLIDYDVRLEVDFYPYFKNLRLPPLYIQSSDSRSVSIAQSMPSVKTWAGVHVDDWGEGEVTISVSGIVAPFRGLFKDVPQELKDSYKDDPVFKDERSSYYLAFNQMRAGVDISHTLGFKYFEQFLSFWRSNAVLYSKDNLPVVQGNVVLYTEYSVIDFDLPNNKGKIGTELAADRASGGQSEGYEALEYQYYKESGVAPIPGEVFIGNFSSFDWEEVSPYMWKINFTLSAKRHFINIAKAFGSQDNAVEAPAFTEPYTGAFEYRPQIDVWSLGGK